jgi:signal transduction histidine kinase/ligand-binding sensor domain-containing protein/DNA-binding response OmpR family regulator
MKRVALSSCVRAVLAGIARRPTRNWLESRRANLCLGIAGLVALLFSRVAGADLPPSAGQYFLDSFGMELGLPHNNVVAATQTKDGYLWVATFGGLARFDGARFVAFRTTNTPAFASHAIRCLFEDRERNLWIGTDKGVVVCRQGVFKRMEGINAQVNSLAQDTTGRVWIATTGQGLYFFEGDQLHPCAIPHVPNPSIRCLFVDSSDRLWLGFQGQQGMACYEQGHFTWYDADGRLDDEIQAMCETPRGTLWFGGYRQGLYRQTGDTFTHYTTADGLTNGRIIELRPARGGGLWVLSNSLQKIEDPGRVAFSPPLPNVGTSLASVCEDHEGSIWISAREDGLIRARRMPYRLISSKDGLPGDSVKSVSIDRHDNIWMTVQDGGVARLAPDGTLASYTEADGFPGSDAGTVFAASDGRLYLSGLRGLTVWRDGVGQRTEITSTIRSIFEDHAGTIWLGTAGGRGVMRQRDGALTSVVLPSGRPIPFATSFAETPEGALYIGTWSSGLFKLEGERLTSITQKNGLPCDEVRAIHVDKEGRVWLGLKGPGLAVLQDGRWLHSNALAEAVVEHVSAIGEDARGRLWLGTPAGIMCATKEELIAAARGLRPIPHIRLVGMSDAAHIAPVWSWGQPTVARTRQGHLLFATRRGVVEIDPENISTNEIPPPVHIERVSIDGRVALYRRSIVVPANTRELTIEYTAMSTLQPSRMRFKYRLEGYDREWVDAGTRRVASYTNLPSGEYAFRVIACNSDGVWNERGARLAILREPRFHETWWFYGLVIAGALGLGFGVYWFKTAALRWENLRLEKKISERTRELKLANTAKSEFLENLSHEIRNPLNGLNGLLGLLHQESTGAKARELMDSVQACAQSLTRIFEEVLGHSMLEYGRLPLQPKIFSLHRLLEEVAASFAWEAAQKGNHIRIALPPTPADGFEGDEGKIKTVVSNFLSNAIKYAPGTAIEIKAEAHATGPGTVDLHIDVCDQGPGIPPEEQELVFNKFVRGSNAKASGIPGTGLGLATCRVLARTLGGSVGIDSEPGRGSVFYLSVPLRCAEATAAAPKMPIDGFSGTALIVEDERYNQTVLQGIARALNLKAAVAGTVAQAEALLDGAAFDVIFLDWELHGLKGAKVARRVRARPDGAKPIIIATTAHDSEKVRRQCREAGMDDFLLKPYDAEQVRQLIRTVQTRRSGQAVAPWSAPAAPTDGALDLRAFRLFAQGAPTPSANADATRLYLEALDREQAAAERAWQAGEPDALRDAAHRLHSLAGFVASNELCAAARQAELLPPNAPATHRASAYHDLGAAVAALKQRIAALTGDCAPPA